MDNEQEQERQKTVQKEFILGLVEDKTEKRILELVMQNLQPEQILDKLLEEDLEEP